MNVRTYSYSVLVRESCVVTQELSRSARLLLLLLLLCVCARMLVFSRASFQRANCTHHVYVVSMCACGHVLMYMNECTAPIVWHSPILPAFTRSVVLFLSLFCHLENGSLCPTLLSTLTTVTALTGYSYKFFRRTCECLSAVKSGA